MYHIDLQTRSQFYALAAQGKLSEMRRMQNTHGLLANKCNSLQIRRAAKSYAGNHLDVVAWLAQFDQLGGENSGHPRLQTSPGAVHINCTIRAEFYTHASNGELDKMRAMQNEYGLLAGKLNSKDIRRAALSYAKDYAARHATKGQEMLEWLKSFEPPDESVGTANDKKKQRAN